MVKSLLLVMVLSAPLYAADTAAGLAKSFQDAGLDPEQCYRVRDLSFQRDDLRFYLTEGHLIFSRPVEGRRFAAVFTTDLPGGDAEVIVFPPHRSERLSLAAFTKTPNFNEHLTTGLFLFTDGSGERLLEQVTASASSRRMPEAGLLLEPMLTPVLKNIAGSYETRLVQDFMSSRGEQLGLFYAAVQGKNLGNFDIIHDPRAREQIVLGQVVYREDRRFFNIWTSFMARPYRMGQKTPPKEPAVTIKNIQIDATLQPDMHMKAVTRLTLTAGEAPDRAIPFELSRRMKVTQALVNGEPAEIFARDSLRMNLMRGENELFLVILPSQLAPGRDHTIEFHHEGNVVARAGNGVYYVAARNSWYPNRDTAFARYDLTFRYPKNVDLVATGDIVEDKTEGDLRITRRTTPTPVRFAGFNLGTYEKMEVSRSGFRVQVYANRTVESALQPRLRDSVIIAPLPGLRQGRRPPEIMNLPMATPLPNPVSRLQLLAQDVSAAVEFLSAQLGPPPLSTLTVSPIPGAFGQGFPGLIYLSTLAYLEADQRPPGVRTEMQRTFFSELLHAHEVAHQWWGNLVTSESYQDEWVMEALANYGALLFLEKRKGRRAIDDVLSEYRDNLLQKDSEGKTLESSGPIIWGARLNSSESPRAWRMITYEKGSWIVHMLRMQMGDAAFLKMLGEVVRRHRFKSINTENFRQIAAGFMPPGSDDPKLENFFEQWVYGTGIPTLKLSYTVTGKAPKARVRGTITQSGVPDDFAASIPVEVQIAGRKPLVRWIRTASDATQFTIEVPRAPSKVILAPGQTVLAVKN